MGQISDKKNWLSTATVAEQLGVNPQAITQMRSRGVLVTERIRGDKLSVAVGELDRARERLRNLCWMFVTTPENWRRLSDPSLEFTALPDRVGGLLTMMRPGQNVLFYVTRHSRFVASASIAGELKRKSILLPTGAYSFQVALQSRIVLPVERAPSIRPLLGKLQFIARPAAWEHYIRQAVRLIPHDDFELVEAQLKGALAGGDQEQASAG